MVAKGTDKEASSSSSGERIVQEKLQEALLAGAKPVGFAIEPGDKNFRLLGSLNPNQILLR